MPSPSKLNRDDESSRVVTLGYEHRDIAEFVELLRSAAVDVLVDVRETAWSHKPGFSKTALERALARVGIVYLHWSWAGNPKRLRDSASSHRECLTLYEEHLSASTDLIEAFVGELQSLVLSGLRVCLTCYERHPGDCHRGILAEYWVRETGGDVHHLAPDGRPRLAASVA